MNSIKGKYLIINSTFNKLEQKVHDLQDESDSLQLAIKLIAQDKYCQHGNQTQSSAPGHCPEEWNKAHTNNKQRGSKPMQSNSTSSIT